MIITPAILAHNEQEFRDRLSFAPILPRERWHIDILDGTLHNATCWHDAAIISTLSHLPDIELHLMVQNPFMHILEWHQKVQTLTRVLIDAHTENLAKIIRQTQALALDISLTLNPSITPDRCIPYQNVIQECIIMGVQPGCSGQSFLGESVFATIARTRALMPNIAIAVDGGIHEKNIALIAKSGVTRGITASALWKSANPQETYTLLETSATIVL